MMKRVIKKVMTPEALKHLGEDKIKVLQSIKCEGKKD